jgi:hypothetical protein
MEPESIKIDFTVLEDGYILRYDQQRNKLIFVDADEVLLKSVQDGVLPQAFIDKLDIDLDDKINLDSGLF